MSSATTAAAARVLAAALADPAACNALIAQVLAAEQPRFAQGAPAMLPVHLALIAAIRDRRDALLAAEHAAEEAALATEANANE